MQLTTKNLEKQEKKQQQLMKEKLKRIHNCKPLWITAFCLVQIAFVSANIFYYSRTNYCCDIYITSPTNCEVSFVTPIGTTYTQNVKANVTFREYKRPLAEVHAQECAIVKFSSNDNSILDTLTFLSKRLGLLYMILTILLTIPLLLNTNNKTLWALCLIVQVPFIAIFIFLYINTNCYCGITVFSSQECIVNTTSPMGIATKFYVHENEDIYIEPDAIKVIDTPEHAIVRFDSDTISVIDVFDYYCRQYFFFYWFGFTFMLLLPFLIRSWQSKTR